MALTTNAYVAAAERLAAYRRSTDPEWLTRARRVALDRFDRLGFPTTKDEDWRFTSVAPIADARFELPGNLAAVPTRAHLAPLEWAGPRAATLVFVNGRFAEAASTVDPLPSGVHVESLARALGRPEVEANFGRAADGPGHAFTALNTACVSDGALIVVPDGAIVEAPVHLVFLAAGSGARVMAHPRVLVVAGVNSQVSIVESYGAIGTDGYLTNAVTEILAADGAVVHHDRVQRESVPSFHVGGLFLRASRDANIVCTSITFGGSLVRNDVTAVLDGEGAGCTLNGLYLGDGARLVDNHTTIDHARAHCASREVYKGILADHAQAVFNGRIMVRPDAQKTDAKQTNKALLLSEHAQINTKPQLEIFANDVRCTHGAAIGQIDDEAIFYLRARGLGKAEARQMLIRAFAGDVLFQMALEPLRAKLDAELVRRLPEWRG